MSVWNGLLGKDAWAMVALLAMMLTALAVVLAVVSVLWRMR
jgi:hypothetical protein